MPETDPIYRALDLRAAWRDAESKPARRGMLRTVQLPGLVRKGILATLNEAGEPGVCVPLRSREVALSVADLDSLSDVLGCDVAAYTRPGEVRETDATERLLHVWCRDKSAIDAFASFCALLCERIKDTDATAAFVECMEEFRRLLSGTRAVESSQLLGLVGELLLLEHLLETDATAVRFWQGPRGARQDFRSATCAIEVKTTTRSEAAGLRVRISSIDQLDPPEAGRLFLHLVRLEQVEAGSFSAREIQVRIESRLTPAEVATFRECLPAALLPDVPRYSLLEDATWEVDDEFPRLSASRLVRGQLDPGVGGVNYDLDLGAVPRGRVELDDVLRIFCKEQ